MSEGGLSSSELLRVLTPRITGFCVIYSGAAKVGTNSRCHYHERERGGRYRDMVFSAVCLVLVYLANRVFPLSERLRSAVRYIPSERIQSKRDNVAHVQATTP